MELNKEIEKLNQTLSRLEDAIELYSKAAEMVRASIKALRIAESGYEEIHNSSDIGTITEQGKTLGGPFKISLKDNSQDFASSSEQYLLCLKSIGRAAPKQEIDQVFRQRYGRNIETRHIVRKLKDHGKLVIVCLNKSKKYSFWALPEWITITNGKRKIFNEFAPSVNEKIMDPASLIVK